MEDSLIRKLESEKESRRLGGIDIAHGVHTINHSQFVDDKIIIGGASKSISHHFKKTYESLSRSI